MRLSAEVEIQRDGIYKILIDKRVSSIDISAIVQNDKITNIDITISAEPTLYIDQLIKYSADEPKFVKWLEGYEECDIHFKDDLHVQLMDGKTFGKYPNGSLIPSKGKTIFEVLEDVVNEYLSPSFILFSSNMQAIYEVSVVLSGNYTFYMQYNNKNNIEANTLSIEDNTNSRVLISGASVQTTKIVDVGEVVKYNSGNTNTWSANFQDTNGNMHFSNPIVITWRFKTFHGSVDTFPQSSGELRNMDSLWDNQNTFRITLNKLRYTIAIVSGKSISSIITQNNEPLKANFTKRPSTMSVVLGDGVTTAEYDVYDFKTDTVMNLWADVILT